MRAACAAKLFNVTGTKMIYYYLCGLFCAPKFVQRDRFWSLHALAHPFLPFDPPRLSHVSQTSPSTPACRIPDFQTAFMHPPQLVTFVFLVGGETRHTLPAVSVIILLKELGSNVVCSRDPPFFQDIVATLEEQMRPLVQAELSVLVDVLHRPELLFPPGTEARKKCETGGFISRSVVC